MRSIYSTAAVAVLCISALGACDRKPADSERMPDNTPAPEAITPTPSASPTTEAPAAGGMGMGTSPSDASSAPMSTDPASAPASAG